MTRRRIVVCESDATLCQILGDLLAGEGYELAFVNSLLRIRETVETGATDLVIADAWGPSYETLEDQEYAEITSLARSVPLIMLTGRAWARRDAVPDLGTTVVISKPMDIDILLAKVAEGIQRGLDDPALTITRELARYRLSASASTEVTVLALSPKQKPST